MTQEAFNHFLSTITLLALIFSASSHADALRGKVIRVDGDVHVIDAEGNHRRVEEPTFAVREMDTIVTAEDGSAIVRFNDGALSVLGEKSRLRIEKTNWLSHLGGKIYFTFNRIFGGARQVKTRFATLGIRGTSFIVYDDGISGEVALQEGLLEIESTGTAFEYTVKGNLMNSMPIRNRCFNSSSRNVGNSMTTNRRQGRNLSSIKQASS